MSAAAEESRKLNGTRTETTSEEKEADLKNNSVQCQLINEENISEEKRQSNCPSDDSKTEPEEGASILRRIATNLDLDLLRDNRYLAIVLGRLRMTEFSNAIIGGDNATNTAGKQQEWAFRWWPKRTSTR